LGLLPAEAVPPADGAPPEAPPALAPPEATPALAPPAPAPRLATHALAGAAVPWDECKERAGVPFEAGQARPEPALSGRGPDCA